MATVNYQMMPTLKQWRADSSVTLTIRNKDSGLCRIDALLNEFYSPGPLYVGHVITCDLYFTLDYWLKSYSTNATMNAHRAPAIQALYVYVVGRLCQIFECTFNSLPRELELMFGREMSKTGVTVDLIKQRAKYRSKAELKKYKIWFWGGLACQLPWWKNSCLSVSRLVPAESSRSHNSRAFAKTPAKGALPQDGYGCFVLTMGRDLYMSRHEPGSDGLNNGLFHSCYTAGEAVMAAGSMLISGGNILRVRSDSGHYRPIDNNMVALLQSLQMFRVPLDKIVVEDFQGLAAVSAPVFLANAGDWGLLAKGRDGNLKDNQRTYWDRPQPNAKAFSTLQDAKQPFKTGHLLKAI